MALIHMEITKKIITITFISWASPKIEGQRFIGQLFPLISHHSSYCSDYILKEFCKFNGHFILHDGISLFILLRFINTLYRFISLG